ncbi:MULTISPECIES: hypothetical protein [Streptomyces]|uniref:Uncharacterized protein n=1 Tax=Streptomyces albidoflavus TaxID=1886 RepID=A0ABY3GQ82_9ACTN|nr:MULTISPECIES: hypothetical protein [Streptomyces]MBV7652001.1 hypothetical protein [Streptomyces albidoflavus]MBV7713470.1 hypothetical protein [Streptomyces albidoflavus]RZD91394.1 hypothetical protein C0Q63_03545 [Streptomyces albidoflavus]RZF00616.1 hypothetical protein C0R04_02375 [Streptomyces albidoflavus]RZF02415.1 hypothetical protein C0R03_02375 [Streptomyces albidoflavus]
MTLRFISKDPNTNGDHCPTVWYDDVAKEFVVQGWKAGVELEAACLTTGPIPDTEAVVRLPARMMEILREACDVAAEDGASVR